MMTFMTRKCFFRASFLALAALGVAGCSESFAPTPLNTSKAQEALKTTLEAWKKGDDITSLKNGSPAITAQDLDWLGGAKLVGYQIQGDGKPVDSNLRASVELTLKSSDGKDVVKTVNYLVTTSPSITVFRDIH